MEQIIITKRNGNRVPIQSRRTATNVTSAKQNWTLNGDDTVDITVTSPFKQSYEIGDKITVFGRDYTLNRLSKPKKTGMHEFQYTLQFEGVQYDLLRATYDVTIDTTNNKLQDVQGDSLTGDLRRFLTVLIANANRVFPGKWRLGVCPDTASDITKTFGESDNCLSVLQSILGEFDESLFFDIAIDGGVYVLNILSKAKTLPITLEFGKGNGLYMLSRDNVSSANIVTRLKVYGSASNITSKYRADRLCLPGKSKGQSFIEKPEAVAKYGIFEGRKHFDNIKPTFTGHVQSVGDSVLEFIDPTISFDLNAKMADGVTTKYLIDGVAAKVHFNSGNLAGYEFEVVKYDHATHKITLRKFTDDRGDVFPSETSAAFQFRGSDGTYPGDEYKLVDIALPDELVNKAEADLAEEANKYYDQNSQPKVQYSLSVTKAFVEANFATDAGIVDVFIPGDYVPIKDTDIDVDKSVRIKSITRNVLDPYDYSLTLSDTVTSTSITNRVISDLIDIDKIITINNLKDPARARANWRSSREVLDMVFDPEGDYYTDKIKPNSIDTLALSVGAKSMQFGLTNTVFQPNYNGNPKILRWQGGVLTHYTINEESAVSWMLADGQITLNLDSQAFYIYARCNKSGQDGTIQITSTQHKVDEDANYYWFWIGVINSVDPDIKARSIALTYGFTMINGRFIKTGRIESADGETYFDLDNSEIGGRIVFNANGEQKTLEELGQEALESKDFINNTLPGLLSGLQSQLDGVIEQWFYTVDPSNTTEPTKDWISAGTAEQEKHLGDLYYNTESGKVWRYVKETEASSTEKPRDVFKWSELKDTELAQALKLAQDALDAANSKARIFVSTPYPPYSVGDLWVQGASGDIYRCKTARASGAFTSSDWEKASKYTDDSALNAFINGDFSNTVDTLTSQIDGKVETWFQTTDPANAWMSNDLKIRHLGDMWYNTTTKELKYYRRIGSHTSTSVGTVYIYSWTLVEDAKAIAAYDAASQAQDTADGKRQVFVSTPYPPYDIGDLWVDGKELRRCITAKASGETYNVNDWVIAVSYDNTKTTIDGGIVTSGTIQVAGDNQSILAGITGQGTAASSIRFWAGASFENRATAPYRVLQDGSFYATKANITGTINANAGSIGGFNISSGKIGYGSTSEQDTTTGLALLRDFIRFYNGNQRVLVGCLNSLGYPFNGLFELTGSMGTALEVHHKHENTADEKMEYWYRPKALAVYGNQFNIGKVALFEKGYIGQAYTDILTSWIGITHKFHFTANTTSRLPVDLPTKTQVDARTSNAAVVFDLEIVCDRVMPNTVVLRSQTGGQMYDQNGNTVSTLDMAKGDSIKFRYYNGGWIIINRNY